MPDAGEARARYRRILRFALRSLAQTWWYEILLPRIGLARFAERGRAARLTSVARRFHAFAVELGGMMIKVGQFLSSRLDVLPPEITTELAGLQDEVPPASFLSIRQLAEPELAVPLERAYSSFDEVPVAAASLGQAHRARLAAADAADSGFEQVVVKVQRPGIQAIVDVDLAACAGSPDGSAISESFPIMSTRALCSRSSRRRATRRSTISTRRWASSGSARRSQTIPA